MQSQTSPNLAAPGKGLPLHELLAVRYYFFPKACKQSSWERALQFFTKQGQLIVDKATPLSPSEFEKRVLVDRIEGIEDSSRFWSVAMVMEHLIVVGDVVIEAVVELSHGRVPQKDIRIADVKPKGGREGQKVLAEYKEFLIRYQTAIQNRVSDRNSKSVLKHPWLGKLNCYQWHVLAGVHQNIHRKQVDAILKGVST